MTDRHEPENWFWSADSNLCPHGPEPDDESPEWDGWQDKHPTSDDGPICLDAPAGLACGGCSGLGDMVPWDQCDERDHRRPQNGITPTPGVEHQRVPVWVGSRDCLDREC
ncbi:hypothetical protein AB0F16_25990, partial [Streptomyces tanashiensis]|uniref:hypothetical protein n=1 Tax=Streptomyces tanashiensis TaxID=67367 RepID=UPI003409EEED